MRSFDSTYEYTDGSNIRDGVGSLMNLIILHLLVVAHLLTVYDAKVVEIIHLDFRRTSG